MKEVFVQCKAAVGRVSKISRAVSVRKAVVDWKRSNTLAMREMMKIVSLRRGIDWKNSF